MNKSGVKEYNIVLYSIVYRFFEILYSEDGHPFIQQEFVKACNQENSIFKEISKINFGENINWLSSLKDYFKKNRSSNEDRKPIEKGLILVTSYYNSSLSLNLLHV